MGCVGSPIGNIQRQTAV